MTPAEFHFVSRITDVAKNLTLRNATANMTMAKIMSAEVSELKAPMSCMSWIQLGLIPIPPIIACYLFTKIADYIGRCITKLRQPRVELRPDSQATSQPDDLTADRTEDDPQQAERAHQKIDEINGSTSEGFKDMERARWQIDDDHGVHDHTIEDTPFRRIMVPRSTASHGILKNSNTASENAKDKVVIGKSDTPGRAKATSLTLDRPSGLAKRGIHVQGVGSNSHKTKRDGWWFDARWN